MSAVDDSIEERESPACPLCGAAAFTTVLDDVRDFVFYKPGAFTIARCTSCGLVQTSPRPTPAALAKYYEHAYGRAFARRFQVDSPIGRMVPAYRVRVLERARPLTSKDRVLDVGCGYGSFLKAARDKSSCACVGIDQDPANTSRGADPEHIEYRVGSFDDVAHNLADASFNVVAMYHFLEHTRDPIAALAIARRLLVDDGVLVVEVPAWDGWLRALFGRSWLPLLPPQHLFHFTPATLRAVVERAGFAVVDARKLFYPIEATASFSVWLRRTLRLPARAARTGAHRIVALLAGLALALFFVVVEVPLQLLLLAANRTGHQVVIAKKRLQ